MRLRPADAVEAGDPHGRSRVAEGELAVGQALAAREGRRAEVGDAGRHRVRAWFAHRVLEEPGLGEVEQQAVHAAVSRVARGDPDGVQAGAGGERAIAEVGQAVRQVHGAEVGAVREGSDAEIWGSWCSGENAMNGQPDTRRGLGGEGDDVAPARGDQEVIARAEGLPFAPLIFESRLPLQEQHPLIALLIIPLAWRRDLAG